MATRPMVHLITASGTFHARVVVARLGAEGILTELRGDSGTTYPLRSEVQVFVDPEQVEEARHILLADEAAAALEARAGDVGRDLDGDTAVGSPAAAPSRRPRLRRPRLRRRCLALAWALAGVLVALYLLAMLG